MNRRQLLAGGLAAAGLWAKTGAATTMPVRRLDRIGLQLYTLRDLFAPDPLGTLEKVAALGYREVEYGGGGYHAMDHAALRRQTDRLGLTAPAIHVGYEMLLERFDATVAMAETLGADTLIVPAIDASLRTAEGWRGVVANFNRFGEKLARRGLGFAYHNHAFEFTEKPEGRSLFDRLIDDRDPALVKIELDLYWVVDAGEDPIALIRRLSGQIYSYHVKDRTADGRMVSVGAGTIDFASIFALNDVAGVRHFFVENDEAPPPYLPDPAASIANLRALRF